MAAEPVEDRRVQDVGVEKSCRSGVEPVRAVLAVAESVGSGQRAVPAMLAGAVGVFDVDVDGDFADVVQQGGVGDAGGPSLGVRSVALGRCSYGQ